MRKIDNKIKKSLLNSTKNVNETIKKLKKDRVVSQDQMNKKITI